ncbi:hypothetical protein [Streptosporangium sp. KLBMP 9127]|nr:hypothetical protein [Streptosporangium sp. KLBMP 9127]
MRRTTRTLLGLAAVSATALALALPASAASASTVSAGGPSATIGTGGPSATTVGTGVRADFEDFWGSYYSKRYNDARARARGEVSTSGSRVHVEGRVYDKNSPWWLCGYVQVKFEDEDGEEETRAAKKCGSDGYRSFRFSERHVENVQVRVCYWNERTDSKKYCGRWDYIYEADES